MNPKDSNGLRPFFLIGVLLIIATALPNYLNSARLRAAQPQSGSTYADTKAGQNCTVVVSDKSQNTKAISGVFRSANDSWVVVDGVVETVLVHGKEEHVAKEFWIPCTSVTSVSFATPPQK